MGAPQIQRIAVLGAGLMGHGIALEFAAYGYDVTLYDSNPAQLAQAPTRIAEGLALLAELGRSNAANLAAAPGRIVPHDDLATTVASADLVIEAVVEDLDVKRDLFRAVDTLAPDHAILASNSSSFMPSLLATATQRPDRVLVAHYFNPPHLLPLVELVRGEQTSDETIETLRALYLAIDKRPAVVQKEVPGFVGNRLQIALFREALAIMEAGVATAEDIDTIVTSGFGRRLSVAGIFEIADAGGLDVWLAVASRLYPEIAATSDVPQHLRDRVERGDLGVKAGAGFYAWPPAAAAALRQRIGQGLALIARVSQA